MNYYKIIDNARVIGAGTSESMRRFQTKHAVIMICDEEEAQYMQYKDTLYHAEWMLRKSDRVNSVDAQIEIIEEPEYDEIMDILDAGEEYIEEPTVEPEEQQDDQENQEPSDQGSEEKPMTIQQMRDEIAILKEAMRIILGEEIE